MHRCKCVCTRIGHIVFVSYILAFFYADTLVKVAVCNDSIAGIMKADVRCSRSYMLFTASRQCSSGYRKCANSGRCIDEDWFCDGDNDCGDMSDETDCRKLQTILLLQ